MTPFSLVRKTESFLLTFILLAILAASAQSQSQLIPRSVLFGNPERTSPKSRPTERCSLT